jgi:plastocyanin
MRRIASALILAGCILAACGRAPTHAQNSSGNAQAVTVKSLDTFRFVPDTITVSANTPVQLTLDNRDSVLPHDLVIDDLGGIGKIDLDGQPHSQVSTDFTPVTPGTYPFYCSVQGHREAGMVGTLIVQ